VIGPMVDPQGIVFLETKYWYGTSAAEHDSIKTAADSGDVA